MCLLDVPWIYCRFLFWACALLNIFNIHITPKWLSESFYCLWLEKELVHFNLYEPQQIVNLRYSTCLCEHNEMTDDKWKGSLIVTITLRIVTRLCVCVERFSLSRLVLLVSWPSALLFWFSLMALILFVAAVNDQPTVCSLLSNKRYLVELVEAKRELKGKRTLDFIRSPKTPLH